MADEVVSGLIRSRDIKVVVATTGGLSRQARELHRTQQAASSMLAQGLTSALMMGSLQKERSKLDLQLECDGPLRGLFADADQEGNCRGYVKNPLVEYQGAHGEFEWRPVLGNSGFISVLRRSGDGDYYRSSVELRHFELGRDLDHFFEVSDQLPTAVILGVVPSAGEPLAQVGGVLLQTLPGGDRAALADLRDRLRGGGLTAALEASAGNARALLKAVVDEDLEVLQATPAQFRCSCSRERVINALSTMGKAELEDVLAKEKQADVTCHFCSTRYVINEQELRDLHARM